VKSYEAMFLMDAALATDWPVAETEVKRILDRASAKVLGLKKWDDRKLAYAIGPHKRGLYVLAYFEAEPDKITGIERDVQLSEKLVRVLVIRRDRLTQEDVDKAMAAAAPPKTLSRGDEWSAAGRGRFGAPGEGPEAVPAVDDLDAVSAVAVADLPDEIDR
jgi:ribosomal protein S6